jgi:hypothetical protein
MIDDDNEEDFEYDDGPVYRGVEDEGLDHGPDGKYLPAECIICHEDTQFRCGRCHQPVCEFHPECPNDCDAINPTPWHPPFWHPGRPIKNSAAMLFGT